MEARKTSLFQFLEGNKQFIIPIYQRTYSWTREQCEQLWKDIIHVATTEVAKVHFVGSIVYIQRGLFQVAGMPQLLVIDGQQRLTTLSLLLMALAQAVRKGELRASINSELIYDYFLINRHGNDLERYKLLLTQNDRDTLIALIENRDLPKESSARLYENYCYFSEKIRASHLDPSVIYDGIAKLTLVDIALDRDHDDPQLIFESLNSTGMDLSQADLIRNYILMSLVPEHQRKLYEQHWLPMEVLFGQAHYVTHFDRFMRDYLTIKTRTIPRIDKIYKIFKDFREEEQGAIGIDAVVADIHRYAKLYVRLAFTNESDPQLREALVDINDIEVNVAYPFLLEAYDDYNQGLLVKEDFLSFIRLVESYVFRRAICEIPPNSMNKTFATLLRGIDKMRYRQSVEARFMALSSYKRFPSDEEFRQALLVKDVYHFQRRNYLFRKLENYGRRERVKVEGFTIEHIMPQNPQLSAEWQQELGDQWQDIHNRYLHTIGNLTLTAYNSEMGDRSFTEKCTIPGGFNQSPLYLNKSLGQTTSWNEFTIKKRAVQLIDRAITLWLLPANSEPTDQTLSSSGQKGRYNLDHYASMATPEINDLFRMVRQRILNLDGSVKEIYFKNGIVFRIPEQFAWVHPRQNQIKIEFSSPPNIIDDPEHLLIEKANPKTGRIWNKFILRTVDKLDYAINLVEQSLHLRRDSDDRESDDEVEMPVNIDDAEEDGLP